MLTVVSLSLSLATRFCHLSSSRKVQIQANASSTIRQHMDRDATHWVAPVSRLAFLGAVPFIPNSRPPGLLFCPRFCLTKASTTGLLRPFPTSRNHHNTMNFIARRVGNIVQHMKDLHDDLRPRGNSNGKPHDEVVDER